MPKSSRLKSGDLLIFVKDSCGRQEILILKVVASGVTEDDILFFLYKISWRMRKHPLFFRG